MLSLLQGIKVVDFTTVVLGPYATQFLGDFGAQVTKIESLEGDTFRAIRPGRKDDVGAGFMAFNRSKRSLALNLKHSDSAAVIKRLVADADVVVHNMRARSAEGLGIGYERLASIKPDLVYCYSPGFASHGPDADLPAYDDVIQARSGLAALNADCSGAPQFLRTVACDKVVGMHLALAIVAALVHRLRTGEGQALEVPMLEAMSSFTMAEHLGGRSFSPPLGELGYERLMSAERKPYSTKDGFMAIMPYTSRHWSRFFTLIGKSELAGADWVMDGAQRSRRINELYALIAEAAPTKSNAQWLEVLKVQDIPCAAVNSLDDVLRDPQLQASGLLQSFNDVTPADSHYLQPAFFSQQQQAEPATPAPGLGEHSVEILAELGFSPAEIEDFSQAGLIKVRSSN